LASRDSLSGVERKSSIIDAARPLFAEKGFHGTSIREIARAADVSEALIYKHFPSKEALYEETLEYSRSVLAIVDRELEGMQPGTETLITLIYLAISFITLDVPGRGRGQRAHERLLFHSLIGDITFARKHFSNLSDSWSAMLLGSFAAATAAGDFVPAEDPPINRIWFMHHLAMAINLCHLSGEPAFDYEGSREELAEQAVLFCLRGIGMTAEAIARHYRPKELRALRAQLFL
jgi:AcrR family transcriptional regulator